MGSRIIQHDRGSSQPQSFEFDGHFVTIKYDNQNNPWFNGSEVCKAINVSNSSMAYARLDDDERTTLSQIEGESTQSGKSPVYVSESGLYNLILRSDKPEAKAFKKLVTSEILPSIRKTGSYSLQNLTPAEMILMQAQQLVAVERQIAELHKSVGDLSLDVDDIRAELLDADYFTVLQWCKKQRIANTSSIRSMWGREATSLSSANNIEIKSVIEGGFPVNRYHKSILLAICVAKPRSIHGQMRLPRTSGDR